MIDLHLHCLTIQQLHHLKKKKLLKDVVSQHDKDQVCLERMLNERACPCALVLVMVRMLIASCMVFVLVENLGE